MRTFIILSAIGLASVCTAQQPYPLESVMRFQVWDGSGWTNEISVLPGSRVEWRVTVSYTGANTNVFALGGVRYQPTISNWDNDGQSVDQLAPWRNGGQSGEPAVGAFGMLDKAEAVGSSALDDYGRAGFGTPGMINAYQNRMTSFTHAGGSGGAPSGSWLRIAGSFVSMWPREDGDPWTVDDGNRVARGVGAGQFQWNGSESHPYFIAGTQDNVLLRQAVTLSADSGARTLELTTGEWSMLRAGGVGSADNRRFISWYDSPSDDSLGSYRSSVSFVPATIHVIPPIPAPGAIAVCAGGALILARKRRR
ncbi:MAG TPA: hypothetical protein VD971_07310 [Phycisphaerales bacterium]|nr:hypothetical protein [Phycisphaerales bacterium]